VAYGTGSQAKVNSAGTVGQVLVSGGAGVPTFSNASSVAVTSFSGASTGLTPATATTGAVSLAGTLAVGSGGTSLTTLTANNVILGNGTSAPTFVAPGTSGNVLQSNGTIWTSAAAGGTTFSTKTTTYTAVNGDYLFCDTSSAAFTITLPASPTINNTVYFQDAKGSFDSNALTIGPGANNIMGSSGDLVVTLLNAGFGLFYNGTEWRIF
jgi:hypothetical protein